MSVKEEAIKARNRKLGEKVVNNLKARKFEAYYVDTIEEAKNKVLSLISERSSVSWGGTMSMEEAGVLKEVRNGNYRVIDREQGKTIEERHELMHQAFFADYYLTSFNAVSEDGVLINIDGTGNRVAAIAYGPKNVIAIVGMNKVCKDVESAVKRARNFAAPVNAQRWPENNMPCLVNGSCGNCKSDTCICSYLTFTRMSKPHGRIKVVLVGESLGI